MPFEGVTGLHEHFKPRETCVVESGSYRRKQRLRTALRIVTPRDGCRKPEASHPRQQRLQRIMPLFVNVPGTRRVTDWRGPSPGFAGDCARDSFKAVPRFGETVAKGSFCLPP